MLLAKPFLALLGIGVASAVTIVGLLVVVDNEVQAARMKRECGLRQEP